MPAQKVTDSRGSSSDNIPDPLVLAERGVSSSSSRKKGPSTEEAQTTPSSKYGRRYYKIASLFVGIVLVICAGIGVAKVVFHTGIADGQDFGSGAPLRDVTMEEFALHDSLDDCWVIYYGEVYDMTEYAKSHPGGASIITRLAGTDGTEAYEDFHPQRLLKTVAGTKIGPLVKETFNGGGGSGGTANPCPSSVSLARARVVTTNELALHNTPDKCWVVFNGDVYDMTQYANRHPGGANIITNLAGTDGTTAYKAFHKLPLLNSVKDTIIGPLGSSNADVGGDPGCTDISPPAIDTPIKETPPTGGNTGTTSPCPSGMIMTRLVTNNELVQHNTPNDCWVVFDGDVYDMTGYAKRHPGGAKIITNLAGTDGTTAYRAFHKLSLLNSVKSTMVGPLEGSNTNVGCIDSTPIDMEEPSSDSSD